VPQPSGRSNTTSCRPPRKSGFPILMGVTADEAEPASRVNGRLSPGPIPLARPSPYGTIGWSSNRCPCPRHDVRERALHSLSHGRPSFRAGPLGLRGEQGSPIRRQLQTRLAASTGRASTNRRESDTLGPGRETIATIEQERSRPAAARLDSDALARPVARGPVPSRSDFCSAGRKQRPGARDDTARCRPKRERPSICCNAAGRAAS
jgi:hypothetical protein